MSRVLVLGGGQHRLPITVTVAASISLAYLVYTNYSKPERLDQKPSQIIKPPFRESLDHSIPYPSDAFPGGRDVHSHLGISRAYEWGPEEGPKVLLIHGISTPCLAFGELASTLVQHGYRVCVYDLWGRGYSDTPHFPHTPALYIKQIFSVLSSSSLQWLPNPSQTTDSPSRSGSSISNIASPRFSIIGYSFGGALAMSFTAKYPSLVEHIALLGPGGILRSVDPSLASVPWRLHEWLPRKWLSMVVEEMLCGVEAAPEIEAPETKKDTGTDIETELELETVDDVERDAELVLNGETDAGRHTEPQQTTNPSQTQSPHTGLNTTTSLFPHQIPLLPSGSLDVANVVRWQIRQHPGFVDSLASSFTYGPTTQEHADWAQVGVWLRESRDRKLKTRVGAGVELSQCGKYGKQSTEVFEILESGQKVHETEGSGNAPGLVGNAIKVSNSTSTGTTPHSIPIPRPQGPESLLFVFAAGDPYCPPEQVEEDARALIGEGMFEVITLTGVGHEFAITRGRGVGTKIVRVWRGKDYSEQR